jgi:hypothetical protein
VRNITAALLELDYRRQAMPLQDSIMQAQSTIIQLQLSQLTTLSQANHTLTTDLQKQKKRTLWGTLTGFSLGFLTAILLL